MKLRLKGKYEGWRVDPDDVVPDFITEGISLGLLHPKKDGSYTIKSTILGEASYHHVPVGHWILSSPEVSFYCVSNGVVESSYEKIEDEEEIYAKSSGSFEVIDVKDYIDGSVGVVMDMNYETLKLFAKKGLYQAITDAAAKIVDEHGDS